MKFYETHFDNYIKNNNSCSLHPKLNKLYNSFPKNINDMKNIILYGPPGVGKYTQMLSLIKQYSPSHLKYEKKISVTHNKNTYLYKISDIHYEIDMSLLGCQSKMLWNEIYNTVVDIIIVKQHNSGIIVCKYFHEIHSELLDNFYSYMQTMPLTTIDLKFILITEQLSFIPNNILKSCFVINIQRPSRLIYNKCINNNNNISNNSNNSNNNIKINDSLDEIVNIKNIYTKNTFITQPYKTICDNILLLFINNSSNENINFILLRENLYDILIYNININDCIWYILQNINKKISNDDISLILIKMYNFLYYYNNNYRPIYHLENFIIFLIKTVNNL